MPDRPPRELIISHSQLVVGGDGSLLSLPNDEKSMERLVQTYELICAILTHHESPQRGAKMTCLNLAWGSRVTELVKLSCGGPKLVR